jgi:hypothetical protein
MKLRIFFAAGLAAAGLLFAQTQIGSGDIRGIVVDPAGGGIPRAKVTVSDRDRGISRSTQSDANGEYRVALLPPGIYRVRVEAPGFSTRVIDSAELHVGEALVLRVSMEVGAVTTEVTVAAEAPVIETERTQQATTIDSRRIQNLPINRRNYLDFALLAPSVVETNDIVDGTDYRVVQAPQSGLSFGGGNGRGNAFTIDGVANYFNSGGVRPSVSQEVVREFQINRNSFSAEYGGSTGGAINITTKSGSNDAHGNVFGFVRHRDIQARNYFDPSKSAFTRAQYGATFSAPVRRDRTFLFAGFERLDRNETVFVPILQDRSAFSRLTPSQQQLADYFDIAPVPQLRPLGGALRQALITENYPSTLALFNRNSGNFPFGEGVSQFSVRLDQHFSENDRFFLRGSLTDSSNDNTQFGALIGFNRGRSIDQFDGALMASNTYVINPRWVTETRLMFGYNKLNVQPVDAAGPEINITGYGFFGREIFLPSTTFERQYQLQQIFDFSSGRHTVKFGVDVNPVRDTVRSETFFGGRFTFGEAIPLGLLLNTLQRDPNAATNLANTLVSLGQARLAPNLNQPITALQAYNLGLPILYQQGFGDPNWIGLFKRYAGFAQDSFRVTRTFTLSLGMRYELEDPPRPVPADRNNFAPRIGFAWNPDGDSKTVLRAGYGIYYGQTYAQVANLPATLDGAQIAQAFLTIRGIPGLNNPRTGQPLTSADIYQTLAAQGVIGRRSIAREDIAQFNLRPGPNAPGRVLFGIVDDFVSPYSQQASLEVERAIGQFAVSAGYTFNRGAHLVRNLDQNLYYAGRRPDDQPIFGFKDPTILQNNVLESTANSFYHALILQASRRLSRHFAFNAHYTLSKAMDEVTDFNSDWQPHDQLNARAERALSSFHQKHRFVFNGVFESPLTAGRGRTLAENVFGDFVVSPIVIASSGRPFNVLAGFDNLGDNHPTTHRPLGAGRNIGKGPDYFTLDLRLARRFRLASDGRVSLEFTAEGFNLLNRTNFKSINNTVGALALAELPRPLVGQRGSPTSPLSFTSAFDPRQFQFGLKLVF